MSAKSSKGASTAPFEHPPGSWRRQSRRSKRCFLGRAPSRVAAALGLALLLLGARAQAEAPLDEKILPLDQYTTAKGRALATKYAPDLKTLNAGIYHCMPWVEVDKHSISFQRPRHLLPADSRYLSLRIFIEQDPSPVFARLPLQDRASAMYSRYVGPLLRRMTKNPAMTADPDIEGFTIILDWLKQSAATQGDRPVHETIAVFIDRATAADFLAGRVMAREMADRAKILGWDGDTAVGAVRVTLYKDDFVATYKVKNYQLEPGVTCP